MTAKQVLKKLEGLGDEKTRARHLKNGAGKNLYGVLMGSLRKVAKEIKTNHDLGLELWETENLDARLVAILVMQPKELSMAELAKMVRAAKFYWLADWMNAYIVKKHPEKEKLRDKWMVAKNPMLARAGWNLTAERVGKSPEGLDLDALL
ncbi:MAG: DNA alkylation repair protein, partial [Planctomycetota bacterium]